LPNAAPSIGPWAPSSYAAGGISCFKGRVEAIDDPDKRNRCQIRMFGYQDDQGLIPKNQLEWMHMMSHDSQIPGATSTHNYYPGAEVMILDTGTERFIMGAHPGFDGSNRLSNNPWGVDNSPNQTPDVPNIQAGQQQMDSAIRGQGYLVGPQGSPPGANNYFNYQSFQQMMQQFYPYSTGKGAPPAPWGQGQQSKFDQLKSIALQPNQGSGTDVLNVIQQLDGNQSGSIQQAIQLILNLRNNGYGNPMNVIGQGNFNAALSQYTQQFGSTTQNNLISLILQLLAYIVQVKGFTAANFYSNVSNLNVSNIISFLGNATFDVGSDVLDNLQDINDNVQLSSNNSSISYYQTQLSAFLLGFSQAVSEAFTAIIEQIEALAASMTLSELISTLGGQILFTEFSAAIVSIATYLGIPAPSISSFAAGAIALAVGGGLSQVPQQTSPSSASPSSSSSPTQNIVGLLSVFIGNQIGTQETLSGGLIPTFLSGNPIMYKKKPTNDGQPVLKRFPA
jgi:hypothetical protein